MDDFTTYLANAFWHNYVEGEYNHIVEDLYDLLIGAFGRKCDGLSVTSTQIVFSKGGTTVRELDIAEHERWGVEHAPKDRSHWMSYRDGMRIILKRNQRVRQHVKLVEDTPNASVYRLLPDPQPDG